MSEVHRTSLGTFELMSLSDGFFRLDGGAMFGIVPKPLWVKRIPSDERNRIRMGLRPLLVRTKEGVVLIDTGIGDKYSEKEMDIYAIEHPPTLAGSLEEVGVDGDEIDVVVNTHLHFDHAGGNTVLRDDKTAPAFPTARYLIQEREWLAATRPGRRSKASYLPVNVLPLEEGGILERVNGEAEVLSGIHLHPTPGHTGGHQSVRIESEGEVAFYFGDLIPTSAHVDPPWVMAYDLYPQETVEWKEEILARAADGNWLVVFEHDAVLPWGRIEREGGGFRVRPA